MCESPTNNSLASWDSGMWSKEGGGRKRAARLCARNSFPFLPKTELIPVGYPCVGWLQLLRRRYTHRCLQIWLPPAASDWIQGWDSAPQNTTRKHKMASRTSAILGLLKNTIRSTFREFFFFFRACCITIKKEQLFGREWWRIDRVPRAEMKPTDPRRHTHYQRVQSKRATWTQLVRRLARSQRKMFPSMFLWIYSYYQHLVGSKIWHSLSKKILFLVT